MKVVNLEEKKKAQGSEMHDSILDAFDEIKKKLEDNEEKAEAMVCFLKSDNNQYYTSVVVNYQDVMELIGFIDVMKTSMHDAIGD